MRVSAPFNADDGVMIDTATKLSRSEVQAMLRAIAPQRLAIWRYVFYGPPRPGDLDAGELDMLLECGVWVAIVPHVPTPPWDPSPSDGLQHAQAAVSNAIRAGYVTPVGCRPVALDLDMEGLRTYGPGSVSYARQGLQVRLASGYQPLCYNGYDCGLKSGDCDSFNADPSCGGDLLEWWCDFAALPTGAPSDVRPRPAKGYAGHQRPTSSLAGVSVDRDIVLRDDAIWGLVEADAYIAVADTVPPAVDKA